MVEIFWGNIIITLIAIAFVLACLGGLVYLLVTKPWK